MRVETRVIVILTLVILIAAPAAVLRALCIGRSCDREVSSKRTIPFCSLPGDMRRLIAAGYREGRSPDVLAVTEPGVGIIEGQGSSRWPVLDEELSPAAVLFVGQGVSEAADLRIGLDDIAPTTAAMLHFEVPHPEVRSGEAPEGIAAGRSPRLLLLVVITDVDPTEMNVRLPGGVAAKAEPVSLPRDTAALYATIGTGGTPAEHGVTGSVVRDDRGDLADAWMGPFAASFGSDSGFPGTVIATLADDLDDVLHQKPKVGLIAQDRIARGLTGGHWYIDVDGDESVYEAEPQAAIEAAKHVMEASGFGHDRTPDLLAVSLDAMDIDVARTVDELFRTADKVAGGRAGIVVVGLPVEAPVDHLPVDSLVEHIERTTAPNVVEESVAGGLFLDQDVLAAKEITKDQIVRAMRDFRTNGAPVFADVFPGIAVSFARFC